MKSHYTYKLIALNPLDERVEYIGVRSCSGLPADDTAYMSSSREIRALIKSGVQFVKEIIAVHESRKKAVDHEVRLHADYDVARSPRFFNKAKQTSVGFDFDCTGIKLSDLQKQKLSVSTVNRYLNQDARTVTSVAVKAACNEPEYLKRLSIKSAAIMADADVRRRIRETNLITYSNGQVKQRIGQSIRAAYKRPEAIQNKSNAMKIVHNTPEVAEKKSAGMKFIIGKKREYCIVNEISDPGKSYSNIDKADFQRWLAANNKEAA